MRRAVCFVVALVFLLALSCTAFAAPANSAGDGGKPTVTPGSGSNPKTGDVIMTWMTVMLLSLIALAAIGMMLRKFAW